MKGSDIQAWGGIVDQKKIEVGKEVYKKRARCQPHDAHERESTCLCICIFSHSNIICL